MTLRQRQPRQRNPKYLEWLRAQQCACGCFQGPPCEAAHIRAGSLKYSKPMTGIGIKPDDKWALPLKRAHHAAQHHHGDEIGWWSAHGIGDPFALAIQHYRKFRREK